MRCRQNGRLRPPVQVAENRWHREGGWGARIRTWEWRNQNPLPYHLATPQGSTAFGQARNTSRMPLIRNWLRFVSRDTDVYRGETIICHCSTELWPPLDEVHSQVTRLPGGCLRVLARL